MTEPKNPLDFKFSEGAVDPPDNVEDILAVAAINVPQHGAIIECYGAETEDAIALREMVMAGIANLQSIAELNSPQGAEYANLALRGGAITTDGVIGLPPKFKLSRDGTVIVSTEAFFCKDMSLCPTFMKVLLLSESGICQDGYYDGSNPFYVGWFPIPGDR